MHPKFGLKMRIWSSESLRKREQAGSVMKSSVFDPFSLEHFIVGNQRFMKVCHILTNLIRHVPKSLHLESDCLTTLGSKNVFYTEKHRKTKQ